MTLKQREEAIQKYMRLLRVSRAEAEQIVADDEIIDKGGRCDWEPSIEEEKAMRKASKLKVERKKTERKPREKVADNTKLEIISLINEVLAAKYEDVVVENAEKTINFVVNGDNYSINLTKHRK